MQAIGPHYLLFSEAVGRPCQRPRWRFVLQPIGGGEHIAAEDFETNADRNRLQLLAVVRGLEALEQPSRVTLLAAGRYVRRGIRHDLHQWRERNWQWERFGRLVPIRDQDLWQRVDRALAIHRVECWPWKSVESQIVGSASPTNDNAAYTVGSAHTLESDEPALVIVPRRRRFSLRTALVGAASRAAQVGLGTADLLGRPALSRTG
jgi:ribonuclease HI